ncbi:MAG: DNA repair protein RecN [Legionella sp.]|nr:DNA repair protein RecN [Legionella sp.]
MLTTLSVKNFVIVDQLELDFFEGMTAFTGETGAGKSIMIDALTLALGGRAEASVVRAGQEKCDITACFQIDSGSEPAQWLINHKLENEDDTVLLRRIIFAQGRSKSYINGHPFPLQKVRELSETLVHIHGQHQQQTLLDVSTHRVLLDRYACANSHGALLEAVRTQYENCHSIKQKKVMLSQQMKQHDRKDLLAFQVQELSQLNLEENETSKLQEEHKHLHHAQDYLQRLDRLMTLLSGEGKETICGQLHESIQLFHALPQENSCLQNGEELLKNALIQCEEALEEIKRFSEIISVNPDRLEAVESRMGILYQAARKYRIDVHQLVKHRDILNAELEVLKKSESDIVELDLAYEKALKTYQALCKELSESRKQYALKLSQDITSVMKELGMPKGYLEIIVSPHDSIQPHGLDKVEYKVCTNPGTSSESLAKIISGGELSRISLAIQMITAQRGSTPTLLFDEVDVGIGGATAAMVGQLLRQLGKRLQVFCVTHQPQVASYANQHFVVEKHTDNVQTYSQVSRLQTRQEKINEIARMLGGLTITDQTRSNARDLIRQGETLLENEI